MSGDFAIDSKAKTRLLIELRSDDSFSYHRELSESPEKKTLMTALNYHEFRDVIGV